MTVSIPLQVFRLGGLGIAAILFATFTETGLEIKAKRPSKDTFTIGLANGGCGDFPTPEQHEPVGYETWLGPNRVETEASHPHELFGTIPPDQTAGDRHLVLRRADIRSRNLR